jgi:aldehyde:ferredoxin oxidoreductase
MHGWTGRMLRVDLHNRSSTIEEIDEEYKRCGSYVGAILVNVLSKVNYTRSKPITLVIKPKNQR